MTIDERLEYLALRHQALAESVELMGIEMREGFAKTQKALEEITEAARLTNRTVLGLVEIAQRHESRLDDLEGK
jgi:hypothetical protein